MNRQRRKEIRQLIEDIAGLPARIEDIAMEEQDAYDGMSEGRQESDAGVDSLVAIDTLTDAKELMDELFNTTDGPLDKVVVKLKEAAA